MNITILHYHLRPGGVTTVIRNAQRALTGNFNTRVLADFGYNDKPARDRDAFVSEADSLAVVLAARLKNTDVLHTHNLNLGKNPRLTLAVKRLAQKGGLRVLNQVHDFAEDHRPARMDALRRCTGRRDDRFWREMCYYDLPNVRWATLTTHDAVKLAACGVPPRRISVLPNAVDDVFFTQPPSGVERAMKKLGEYARRHDYPFDPARRILLAPMKVMMRKNNAEAVELVRRLGRYQLIISLDAASSPADMACGERLKQRIRRERLPVVIGFGRELEGPLPLFHLAHAVVTTSKQEGFGYMFIEGWLCRKLVVGRDIPEVTRDFTASGMDLSHLYRKFNPAAVHRIARLLKRPPRGLIAHNRTVVLRHYSLAAYARRYARLLHRWQAL